MGSLRSRQWGQIESALTSPLCPRRAERCSHSPGTLTAWSLCHLSFRGGAKVGAAAVLVLTAGPASQTRVWEPCPQCTFLTASAKSGPGWPCDLAPTPVPPGFGWEGGPFVSSTFLFSGHYFMLKSTKRENTEKRLEGDSHPHRDRGPDVHGSVTRCSRQCYSQLGRSRQGPGVLPWATGSHRAAAARWPGRSRHRHEQTHRARSRENGAQLKGRVLSASAS